MAQKKILEYTVYWNFNSHFNQYFFAIFEVTKSKSGVVCAFFRKQKCKR